MTIKKFTIFTSIIIAIVLITTIVLGCVKIDNGIKVDAPNKFILYKETSTGVELSLDQRPSDYKKLNKLYKNMTNLSIVDYMANGVNLNTKPAQDIDGEYGTWKESFKTSGYCLELIFSEKQSVIVNIDGKTKVLEFYGLIMKVEKTIIGHETALYYSTSTGSSKSYNKNPILVSTKQNTMYNFMKNL